LASQENGCFQDSVKSGPTSRKAGTFAAITSARTPLNDHRESTATHTPKTQAQNPMIEQQPRKKEEEKQKQ
jgi:hypothetical protein